MKVALLIPIYEPSEKVLPFLMQFKIEDFDAFLVVDDGSGEKYTERFEEIRKQTVFDVYSYPINHGKGHALKEGIASLLSAHPDLDLIVTADGDGQHAKEDILNLKQVGICNPRTLCLGVRTFENAPTKSKSGNYWVSKYFKAATGRYIEDTQTGLRVIPKNLFEEALTCYGERFEYEMNFLKDAVYLCRIKEVPIQTIYEDENKGTHFRPVKDSFRIMGSAMRYFISGLFIGIVLAVAYFLISFPTSIWERLGLLIGVDLFCFFLIYVFRNYVVFHRRGFGPYRLLKAFLLFFAEGFIRLAICYGMHKAMGDALPAIGFFWTAFGSAMVFGIFNFFLGFWVYHPQKNGK